MNTMFLQLASLAHQLTKDGGGTAVKSEKAGTRFLPIIQKSMSLHARKSVYHANPDAQMDLIGKDGQVSIESLRKAFFGKRRVATKHLSEHQRPARNKGASLSMRLFG